MIYWSIAIINRLEFYCGNLQATVEEMYRGEFEVGSTKFTLDIEDTSGTFAWDFPAMVEVSLGHADAVLLVFSVGDRESFEQVSSEQIR